MPARPPPVAQSVSTDHLRTSGRGEEKAEDMNGRRTRRGEKLAGLGARPQLRYRLNGLCSLDGGQAGGQTLVGGGPRSYDVLPPSPPRKAKEYSAAERSGDFFAEEREMGKSMVGRCGIRWDQKRVKNL